MVNAFLPAALPPSPLPPDRDASLRATARDMEAAFLAEMLKHSGLTKALSTKSGFGGEAFSSLLVETYAEKIAAGGRLGLAETIYVQLKDKER